MTEALRKWADATAGKNWPSPHIDKQAEFWVRAFVEEIERRSKAHGEIAFRFKEFKLELLGEIKTE